MSASLDELEQEQPEKREELDDTLKREMQAFLGRYCMSYQHNMAKKALEELLKQAKTHR